MFLQVDLFIIFSLDTDLHDWGLINPDPVKPSADPNLKYHRFGSVSLDSLRTVSPNHTVQYVTVSYPKLLIFQWNWGEHARKSTPCWPSGMSRRSKSVMISSRYAGAIALFKCSGAGRSQDILAGAGAGWKVRLQLRWKRINSSRYSLRSVFALIKGKLKNK